MKSRKLLPIIAADAVLFNFSPAFADSITFAEDGSVNDNSTITSSAKIKLRSGEDGDITHVNQGVSNNDNTQILIGTCANDGVVNSDFTNIFKFNTNTQSSNRIKIDKKWNINTVAYDYTLSEGSPTSKSVDFVIKNNSEYSQTVQLKFTPSPSLKLKNSSSFEGFVLLNVSTESKHLVKSGSDYVPENITIDSTDSKTLKVTVYFNELDLGDLVSRSANSLDSDGVDLFTVTCTLLPSSTSSNTTGG